MSLPSRTITAKKRATMEGMDIGFTSAAPHEQDGDEDMDPSDKDIQHDSQAPQESSSKKRVSQVDSEGEEDHMTRRRLPSNLPSGSTIPDNKIRLLEDPVTAHNLGLSQKALKESEKKLEESEKKLEESEKKLKESEKKLKDLQKEHQQLENELEASEEAR
ncbi:hypothetical protein V5O48_019252, partial [Marasmius crinis-equi]